MYTCAQCAKHACFHNDPDAMPKNCPIREHGFMEETFQEYLLPENHGFFVTSSEIESLGYGQWPRLRETIEFAKRMGYHKLGLGFCFGLRREAKVVDSLLRRHGFEVVSVICKTGGIDKERVGISPERKLHPGQFEAMCNPIAQARLLNSQHTELNISFGLCVGHDSLFNKYSEAMVTTLVVKDRVLAHNPIGAVYCAEGYFRSKLEP